MGQESTVSHECIESAVPALMRVLIASNTEVGLAHIQDDRVRELAGEHEHPTDFELEHLASCHACAAELDLQMIRTVTEAPPPAPAELLQAIEVCDESVAFDDGSFSHTSLQFGRINDIEPAQRESLLTEIGERLAQHVLKVVRPKQTETLVLATFGHVMFRCGEIAQATLRRAGYLHVEPVLVTDAASPKFNCGRDTLFGAQVVCVCDVSHRAQLLERMAETARAISPTRWVYRIATVKKYFSSDDDGPAWGDHTGLWYYDGKTKDRRPVSQFQGEGLRFFEPESSVSLACSEKGSDLAFQTLLHYGGVKVNAAVEGNKHLFVVDPRKLLISEPDPLLAGIKPSRTEDRLSAIIKHRIEAILKDLCDTNERFVVAYNRREVLYGERNGDRQCRAERVACYVARAAELLTGIAVPTCGIGVAVGEFEHPTLTQRRALRGVDRIILVDGAIRSGESFRSLYAMVRKVVGPNTEIAAISMLAPSSSTTMESEGEDRYLSVYGIGVIPLFPAISNLDVVSGILPAAVQSSLNQTPKLVGTFLKNYQKKRAEAARNCSDTQACLDSVHAQMSVQPCLKRRLADVVCSMDCRANDREKAILILAALREFDWLRSDEWMTLLSGDCIRGTWRVVPATLLYLVEQCTIGGFDRSHLIAVLDRLELCAQKQPTGLSNAASGRVVEPHKEPECRVAPVKAVVEATISWCRQRAQDAK